MVETAREYIVAGDIIQVVPSQRVELQVTSSAFDLYRSLRAVNPSPYMYYLWLDDFAIVGASPEMLVRAEDGLVETHPIAGTRRRGKDAREDAALERELLADEKECAEHVMLLDLGRNDIGRVSKPGTVQVTQMLEVERYSHVMHLVSHVTGELRDDRSVFDALRACFPAGTVSGAPKIRAMQIITELEQERRGVYAGAVGYFSFSGNMDTAIAIRTMVVKNGKAYLQAGGGVVFDSDPEAERMESFYKMNALLRAIAQADTGRGA
jgi:anthranilate synthase component 1